MTFDAFDLATNKPCPALVLAGDQFVAQPEATLRDLVQLLRDYSVARSGAEEGAVDNGGSSRPLSRLYRLVGDASIVLDVAILAEQVECRCHPAHDVTVLIWIPRTAETADVAFVLCGAARSMALAAAVRSAGATVIQDGLLTSCCDAALVVQRDRERGRTVVFADPQTGSLLFKADMDAVLCVAIDSTPDCVALTDDSTRILLFHQAPVAAPLAHIDLRIALASVLSTRLMVVR
jgi:hypothetical protein